MSMFILNSELSERYPTVLDGLMYTYPFDGEKHCCINNARYAKVLSIKRGSDKLHNYFLEKGSLITNSSLWIDEGGLSLVEGQYNIVVIDSDGELTNEEIITIREASNKAKTPILVNSNNSTATYYNYGGSYCYIDSNINESDIKNAITKGTLYNGMFNGTIQSEHLKLQNGYIAIPWDNRLDSFTISLDLSVESFTDNVGIACIANENQPLLSILYNGVDQRFLVKENITEIAPETYRHVELKETSKITITKYANKISVFMDEIIVLTAYIKTSTKGNRLFIGKNNIANIDNSAIIRICNLSIYDKNLSKEEVLTLSKGRLIFA